jgi:hypothetical protein
MNKIARKKLANQWYSFEGSKGHVGVRHYGQGWEIYFRDENGKPIYPTAIAGNTIAVVNYKEAMKAAKDWLNS